ncbi:MAG: hypothetical protein LBV19_07465 [Streptococcaceae bacterium]|nr:hypothetical protein [Streptococcaceae bacterium]
MKLLQFEIKKFLTNKKNITLFVVFTSIFLGFQLQQETQINGEENYIQAYQQMAKQNINTFRDTLSNADEYNLSQEKRREYQDDINMQEKMLSALEKKDVNGYFDLRYEDLKSSVKESDSEISAGMNVGLMKEQKKRDESEMEYIELVKSRGLDFEYQPKAQVHAFGKLVSGLTRIFNSLWLTGFAVILSVSLANIFESKEDRIYHALNINKYKIIGSKLFSSVGVTYIWLWLLSLAFLTMVGIIKGFGSPNYPAFLMKNVNYEQLISGKGSTNDMVIPANMSIPNG